jgi:hypothetical protein
VRPDDDGGENNADNGTARRSPANPNAQDADGAPPAAPLAPAEKYNDNAQDTEAAAHDGRPPAAPLAPAETDNDGAQDDNEDGDDRDCEKEEEGGDEDDNDDDEEEEEEGGDDENKEDEADEQDNASAAVSGPTVSTADALGAGPVASPSLPSAPLVLLGAGGAVPPPLAGLAAPAAVLVRLALCRSQGAQCRIVARLSWSMLTCVCVCVCVCGVRLGTTPSAAQEVAAYGRLAARLVTALANWDSLDDACELPLAPIWQAARQGERALYCLFVSQSQARLCFWLTTTRDA